MTERPVSDPGVRMEFHDLADGALPRFTAEPGAVDVPTENGFEDPPRGGEGPCPSRDGGALQGPKRSFTKALLKPCPRAAAGQAFLGLPRKS